MADDVHPQRREALAQFLTAHELTRAQLHIGKRVVIFVANGHDVEIRAQGIFFGFSQEPEGTAIILGAVPDEEAETSFSEHLAGIGRMAQDDTGLYLPEHLVEARELEERRIVLLHPAFRIADGEEYAKANARTNIVRNKDD